MDLHTSGNAGRFRVERSQRPANAVALAVAAVALSLTGRSAWAANDAYSPDATSGLFSTSFTDGTATPTAGGTSAPVSDDALFFGSLTTGTSTVSNDLVGYTYSGLTFNAGAPAFTISGNAFTLAGNITIATTATENISTGIAVAAGTNLLALTSGAGGLVLGGSLTGSGTLSQIGSATGVTGVTLSADNSGFTGVFLQDNSSSTRTAFNSAASGSAGAAWTFNRTVGGGVALNFGAATINFGSLAGGGYIRNNIAGTTSVLSVGALDASTTFSGQMQGNGSDQLALQKVGTAPFELTGANTYTGFTNVANGTLIVGNGGSLTASSTLTLGDATANTSGVLQLGDATAPSGTVTFTSLATAGTGTGNAIVGGNAAVSTLTVNDTAALTYAGLIGGTGANQNNLGLTKTGNGLLTLTAADTYAGPTLVTGTAGLTLSGGGTVANSTITVGQPGVLASTVLTIDSTAATGSQTNARAGGLTLNAAAGGNGFASLSVTAANVTGAKTIDNFGGPLTVNTGAYALPKFVAGTLGYEQVNFASFVRNAGGVIDFSRGSTATIGATTVASQTAGNENVTFTTAPTLVNGVVIGAIVNQDFATYTSTNGLTQLTGQVALAASGQTAGTQNVSLTSGGTLTMTADENVNSLALGYSTGSGGTTAGSASLNIGTGMISVGQTSTLGNATVNFGSAEGIIVVQNTRNLTVNSVLAGSGGLTVALNNATTTTAYAVLNGADTYTGTTRFSSNYGGMTVRLTNSLALQNTTLDYNNYGGSFSFGNGTTTGLTAYTFGGLIGAQAINLNNNNTTVQPVALTLGSAGSADTASTVNAYSGVLSNTVAGGSIVKAGVATQAFSGANTYSGGTTINAGTLQANNATSSLGTGPTTISGGVLAGGTTAAPGATGAGAVNFTSGTITGGTGATATDTIGTLLLGTANNSAGSVAITLNGTDTYNAKLDGSRLATSGRVTVSPNTAGGTVSAYTSASDDLILSGLTPGSSSTLIINPVLVTAGAGSFAPSTSYYFVIADAKSSATAFNTAGLLTLSSAALSAPVGYSLDTAADPSGGEYLLLDVTTAAPEPTSLVLAGLAAAPLAMGRRRRRSR
jgi:fibronectin-binding autotransporter adhesin